VRLIVELHRTDADVAGTVTVDSEGATPQPFSGWLELLQLLETIGLPPPPNEN
jgi:hypothetical protein